jgi:hypothetical protein
LAAGLAVADVHAAQSGTAIGRLDAAKAVLATRPARSAQFVVTGHVVPVINAAALDLAAKPRAQLTVIGAQATRAFRSTRLGEGVAAKALGPFEFAIFVKRRVRADQVGPVAARALRGAWRIELIAEDSLDPLTTDA